MDKELTMLYVSYTFKKDNLQIFGDRESFGAIPLTWAEIWEIKKDVSRQEFGSIEFAKNVVLLQVMAVRDE